MEIIYNSLKSGFIDKNINANIEYMPKLLVNKAEQGEKVLTEIIKELNNCDCFMFCVAFLTMSGYQVLLKTLIELEERGIKGTIIVSQYQNFTEPKALRRLKELTNIDLRIVTEDTCRMHTKGYVFKKGNEYKIIVGSSNLTQNALCVNKEWNVKLSSLKHGSYTESILSEFEHMYNLSIEVTNEFIDKYEEDYNKVKTIKNNNLIEDIIQKKIVPNKMQQEALANLQYYRDLGEDRSLVVSSTGTGKTILCALDVKAFNPKKFLFIVHREQIAKDALKTFKKVIGKDIDAKLLGGGNQGNGKYVFAMIQTLSKDENLYKFERDEFDYIVFDEAHRIGAKTYQKVFKYFNPKFVLGMTATPERGDGFNIYQLFNYNLACDIRLEEAMKEDLICPFHYYAVADLVINGEMIDDKSTINNLICDDRVKHIINKIQTYGYCGDKVKGLVFVSKVEEAIELSKLFNNYGYKTRALSGSDSQEEREKTIDLLESDDPENSLDYIFTVDIFNEGIDIQRINQIVMLRPTQSAIIFVQQLGRGLRKFYDKDYLVVLDFVGNYDQNFLIPIALSGDNSYNKDNLRRFIKEGNKTIQGASTINFEKIVEKNIFDKIDSANFEDYKILKNSYKSLKNKVGKIPSIFDFERYGSIDILNIFNKYGSYHNFLIKNEKDYLIRYNQIQCKFLELISRKYANGKRPHEIEMILMLIKNESVCINEYIKFMKNNHSNFSYDVNTMKNIINQMVGDYLIGVEKEKYKNIVFATCNKEQNQLIISKEFKLSLSIENFRNDIMDLLEFSLDRYYDRYLNNYENTGFTLFEKYSYEDVCKLLDWPQNQIAQNIGGYRYDKETNTLPIFINYEKSDDISETIKYEDRFENRSLLTWISKNKRNLNSKDIMQIKNSYENNTKIYLFVRKNKNDHIANEFYFLGEIYPTGEFIEINMTEKYKAVKIQYLLKNPVRDELYDYITGE